MSFFQRQRESDNSNPAAAAYAAAATQQVMMAAAGLAGRSALSVPGAGLGATHASMFGGLAQPAVMAHPGQHNNEICCYLYFGQIPHDTTDDLPTCRNDSDCKHPRDAHCPCSGCFTDPLCEYVGIYLKQAQII